jgi:23S rRNA (adenine1618-N6)-methyltransferase
MSSEKTRLHPRNKNKDRYDLPTLVIAIPELAAHVKPNKYGEDSVNFSDPVAVKLLNKALLHHYYGIKKWEFPEENLCPPIPGRADYMHYMADLLSENNNGAIPKGKKITCLDIGVGANCIYPIIGATEYGWKFIGSDVDQRSIKSAKNIVNKNSPLRGKVECRLQTDQNAFFKGILEDDEKIDTSICNPPFHSSAEEALRGTRRKVKNLSGKNTKSPTLNFAGVNKELIYKGGESMFIQNMIKESESFAKNCLWFSSLVSKESNLQWIYEALEKTSATEVKTIPMGTGNKVSRIVAWTFLSEAERKEWKILRWNS